MSTPLEHDYIGLSKERNISTDQDIATKNINLLNHKDTELRLGLPAFGKVSPLNSFVSGAKRGFSDSIDGPGNWAFPVSVGSSPPDFGQPSRRENGSLEIKSKSSSIQQKPAGSAPAPATKAQVVGWPPIRSFRKNTMATNLSKNSGGVTEGSNSGPGGCLYVKVSMDGAPFLRKVDLKTYGNYAELSSALENMFSCFTLGQCTSRGLPEREGLSESRLKDLIHESECVLTYEDRDGDWMLVGDVPWEMFTDSCQRLRIMKGSEAIGLAPRGIEKCKYRN